MSTNGMPDSILELSEAEQDAARSDEWHRLHPDCEACGETACMAGAGCDCGEPVGVSVDNDGWQFAHAKCVTRVSAAQGEITAISELSADASGMALEKCVTPVACWRCGRLPHVDPNGGYPTVACDDCYDGAPDSGTRNELGSGMSRVEAVRGWNERMEMEEPRPQAIIAAGIRVLRTRDGLPVTEDMVMERARNLTMGLTGVRLDGVRFEARRASVTEAEFAAEGRIK